MNTYFAIAGCLAIVVGIIHSVLGEILIFRHMRNGTFIPIDGGTTLKERHVRILWISWHIVTVFGWGFGAILLRLSLPSSQATVEIFVENSILFSMFIASLMVLMATKGKHPGWVGLFCVAILVWLG